MSVLFTSESVSAGHPDKVCDAISDVLLDLHLQKDTKARTAIETLATTDQVIIAGETYSSALPADEEIELAIRQVVKNIGYEQTGFDWKTLKVSNFLHRQSADIALGVDRLGAGDQGIMFGYAKKEKGFETEYMPLPIFLAHRILQELSNIRLQDLQNRLGPDAKSQITVEYNEQGEAASLPKIVVSSQHDKNVEIEEVKELVKQALKKAIPESLRISEQGLLINPTGRFVIGGPDGDAGLTGRKIIVDTYGGAAPHGGGAFSGKDPTKVDRSAAYMLRWLAKNIVAAGLADECLLQISYAIGVAEPLSLYIDTKETSKLPQEQILNWIRENIELTPEAIISRLDLRRPIYLGTSAYGHFGRKPKSDGSFSWEKLDLVKDLQNALL